MCPLLTSHMKVGQSTTSHSHLLIRDIFRKANDSLHFVHDAKRETCHVAMLAYATRHSRLRVLWNHASSLEKAVFIEVCHVHTTNYLTKLLTTLSPALLTDVDSNSRWPGFILVQLHQGPVSEASLFQNLVSG